MATTVPNMLAKQCRDNPEGAALGLRRDDRWHWLCWGQIGHDVLTVAATLRKAGIRPADHVAQIAANDYAWILCDLAILSLGAVHVSLHPDLPPSELERQISHSNSAWVIDRRLQATGVPMAPAGDLIVRDLPAASQHPASSTPTWLTPEQCQFPPSSTEASWRCSDAAEIAGELAACPSQAADLATILFTSGTSGKCRAVALTHANLTSNAAAVVAAMDSPEENESRLLILPLTHIYARTCDLYVWLYRGTRMALAQSRETIVRDCQEVRPTTLNAVPYFYQKIADRIAPLAESERSTALRQALGGDIVRCYSGGAALTPAVEQLFNEAGVPLLSGYGLSEAAPVVTASNPTNYEPGAVGRPLPNVQVRIATDGEVLVQGPNVMAGYWSDAEATAAVVVDDWLHTGDVGEFTAQGNLRIVGRKKELLALSTGKHVWPGEIEALLAGSGLIEQVCLIGERRPYLTALIVPNPDRLRAALRAGRIWSWSRRRLLQNSRVLQLYRSEIDRLLAGAAAHEQIGKFVLVSRMFDVAHGETTAKLSLRREVIAANFATEIAALYGTR